MICTLDLTFVAVASDLRQITQQLFGDDDIIVKSFLKGEGVLAQIKGNRKPAQHHLQRERSVYAALMSDTKVELERAEIVERGNACKIICDTYVTPCYACMEIIEK